MIPLSIFLLACAAVYLGAIEAAFSALMRLSLRLAAERSDRPGALGTYLDDPLLLFIPVRLLLGLVTGTATALLARAIGNDGAHTMPSLILALAVFVLVFELFVPLVIVGGDPERVLELLLPTFGPFARALGPMTRWIARIVPATKRTGPPPTADEAAEEANEAAKAYIDTAEQEGLIEGEERRLLQSIVDFGDTLVREVMTPRPDIVAIRDTATVGDVRALFREQEYSRFPVYKESLDHIAGFVFVKDLVILSTADDARPVTTLLRPAEFVPETKRVPELLKQFQRQQTQCAIVVDEYGGTAGLVTIEDLVEEIVGEIRDEYDVENEMILPVSENEAVMDARVPFSEVQETFGIEPPDGVAEFDTLGGFVTHALGRLPRVGETIERDGVKFVVESVEGRRVGRVRVIREPIHAEQRA
jgi:CBS domain containing-hemolysin-like protein